VRSFTRDVGSDILLICHSKTLTVPGRRWFLDHYTGPLPDRCEPPDDATKLGPRQRD
jgi:hypothetical protein